MFALIALLTGIGAIGADEPVPGEAIAVIVYGDGHWDRVRAVEERGGAFIYTTMEGQTRAAPELALDHTATREVNWALGEFATACSGGEVDFSRLFGLAGRSGQLFRSIAHHYAPGCYQRLRDQSKAGQPQGPKGKTGLGEVADRITLHKDGDAPRVVITNENASAADGAVTQGGQPVGGGYDHLAEYILRSGEVIKNECVHESDTRRMYRYCVERETAAVEKLKNRTVTFTPLEVFTGIRDACRDKWPRKYHMRDDCESEELNSYWSMERDMKDPDFSPAMLQGFRDHCGNKWPGNYRMQRECLVEAMESARPSP